MFDDFAVVACCNYISDLKKLNSVQKQLLLDYLDIIDTDMYSVKELNALVFYIAKIQGGADKENTLNLFRTWLKS